jgi:hypothetical protein
VHEIYRIVEGRLPVFKQEQPETANAQLVSIG